MYNIVIYIIYDNSSVSVTITKIMGLESVCCSAISATLDSAACCIQLSKFNIISSLL